MGRRPSASAMEISSIESTVAEITVEIHRKQVDVTLKKAEDESMDVKMEDDSTPQDTVDNNDDRPKVKRSMKPLGRQTLFSHLPSVNAEALGAFEEIKLSLYHHNDLGESSQQVDVMSCECKPVIAEDGRNLACGGNDCINFATSMECTDGSEGDCNCGADCRNRRFQRLEYAPIDVIQTEKKGYGIRSLAAIPAHTFIYEYVGEVIDEPTFRTRMHEYDDQGIRHFYFMMIQQGEYIDATKRGGLGRFMNHSCAPNCYVDKWVVGTKLRMGIFADRDIFAGEELTFDYNVDRYGADAQPCYCNEPNCIGYIGGKTQSEAQPKLSHAVKEGLGRLIFAGLRIALGFDDETEWSTATSRKRRRARRDEDNDDDYVVDQHKAKPVTEDGVAKVMSTLLQAREQWVITKLLTRLEMSDSAAIWHRVLKMHGYQILGAVLKEWNKENVIVLHILLKLPRVTRNKIDDSRIEGTVKDLAENPHPRVKELATKLLNEWSTLEVGFRISRRPKGTTKPTSPTKDGTASEPSRTPIPSTRNSTPPTSKPIQNTLHRPQKLPLLTGPPRYPSTPTQQIDSYRGIPRGPAATTPLPPAGWKSAFDPESGKHYYYRPSDGKATWELPTEDNDPKEVTPNLAKSEFEKIIEGANRLVAEKLEKERIEEEKRRIREAEEERENEEAKRKKREERKAKREQRHSVEKEQHHRRASEDNSLLKKSRLEKEMEIFFSSYVANTIAKYFQTLSRDEIKKYAKDITMELVKKEMKAGKTIVSATLSDHKKQKVKDFVKNYMGKVMSRRAEREAAKLQSANVKSAERGQEEVGSQSTVETTPQQVPGSSEGAEDGSPSRLGETPEGRKTAEVA